MNVIKNQSLLNMWLKYSSSSEIFWGLQLGLDPRVCIRMLNPPYFEQGKKEVVFLFEIEASMTMTGFITVLSYINKVVKYVFKSLYLPFYTLNRQLRSKTFSFIY